ncbi:MAG: glycosyltransferase family 39 protein [Pseudomonadota bacterium]
MAMPSFVKNMSWADRGFALLLLAFASVAIRFSFAESIWTDESTQLSGLTLSVGDMVMWLAGAYPHPFDLPPDRQPPLSYLVMKVITFMGGGEVALRWLGIAAVLGAATCVYRATRLLAEPVWALFAACFFLLRPETALVAVDIRPYPLLLLFSAVALEFTLRAALAIDDRSRLRNWAGALVAALLAAYDHFFGLMVLGTVGICVLMTLALTKKQVIKTFGLLTIAGLATLPLLPFILAATTVGSHGAEGDVGAAAGLIGVIKDGVRLVYWTVGAGPVMAANTVFLALALISTLILLLALLASLGSALVGTMIGEERPRAVFCLVVSALVGLGLLFFARLVGVSGFDVLGPSYNIWLWPLVALLIGLAASEGWQRWVGSAAAVLVAARAGAMGLLFLNPGHFSHSAGNAMEELLTEHSVEAIIYEPNAAWPSPYFTTTYRRGDDFPQYLAVLQDESFAFQRIQDGGALVPTGKPDISRVLVARYVNMGEGELRASLQTPGASLPRGPLAEKLLADGGQLKAVLLYPSFVGARLEVIDVPK